MEIYLIIRNPAGRGCFSLIDSDNQPHLSVAESIPVHRNVAPSKELQTIFNSVTGKKADNHKKKPAFKSFLLKAGKLIESGIMTIRNVALRH